MFSAPNEGSGYANFGGTAAREVVNLKSLTWTGAVLHLPLDRDNVSLAPGLPLFQRGIGLSAL